MARIFADAPPELARVVVLHQNVLRGKISRRMGLSRWHTAQQRLLKLDPDVILNGHDHEEAAAQLGHRVAVSTAGTLTHRMRGGKPSVFNVVRIEPLTVTIQHWRWNAGDADFAPSDNATSLRAHEASRRDAAPSCSLTAPPRGAAARPGSVALGLRDVTAIRTHRNESVMVSLTRRGELRVHRGYALAPDRVLHAIVRFVAPRTRRADRLAAERVLLSWPISSEGSAPRARATDRIRPGEEGVMARLEGRWQELNALHFEGIAGTDPDRAFRAGCAARLGELVYDPATRRPVRIVISRRLLKRHPLARGGGDAAARDGAPVAGGQRDRRSITVLRSGGKRSQWASRRARSCQNRERAPASGRVSSGSSSRSALSVRCLRRGGSAARGPRISSGTRRGPLARPRRVPSRQTASRRNPRPSARALPQRDERMPLRATEWRRSRPGRRCRRPSAPGCSEPWALSAGPERGSEQGHLPARFPPSVSRARK